MNLASSKQYDDTECTHEKHDGEHMEEEKVMEFRIHDERHITGITGICVVYFTNMLFI